MIKAIIFDCFGVFYTDPVLAYIRDPSSPKDLAEALHNLEEQAAHGRISKQDFIKQSAELLGLSENEVDSLFFRGYDRNNELIAYAQALRKRYKLALLSNIGSDMMDGFFTKQEQGEFFNVALLSGSTGYAKPDHEIFQLVCSQLGVEPTEAVMVDDVEGNCKGAANVGMQAIQYQSFEQMKRELEGLLG